MPHARCLFLREECPEGDNAVVVSDSSAGSLHTAFSVHTFHSAMKTEPDMHKIPERKPAEGDSRTVTEDNQQEMLMVDLSAQMKNSSSLVRPTGRSKHLK